MKTADEMFEELGYEKIEEVDWINYYKITEYFEYRIIFDKEEKDVIKKELYLAEWIDVSELKAINKKVEELGWLDE